MIGISSRGDHKKTRIALENMVRGKFYDELDRYAQQGVMALKAATPVETGLTANSWTYKVFRGKKPGIAWYNTNMAGGTSIAVLIQYGHGTGTGGYITGYDYINPAIRPLFESIANDLWEKVRRL